MAVQPELPDVFPIRLLPKEDGEPLTSGPVTDPFPATIVFWRVIPDPANAIPPPELEPPPEVGGFAEFPATVTLIRLAFPPI